MPERRKTLKQYNCYTSDNATTITTAQACFHSNIKTTGNRKIVPTYLMKLYIMNKF